jgi:hypothetical protein
MYSIPLFAFELTIEALLSGSTALGSIAGNTKQILENFFTDQQGQYNPFVYLDPDDNSATNQLLGVGDGTTTEFTCLWPWGGRLIPIGIVDTAGLLVYANGGLVSSSGYTIYDNTITFATAPAFGVAITATYNYFFLCRFSEDSLEFEKNLDGIWSVKSIKFGSIKT